MSGAAPELAAVVLAVGDAPDVAAAVESLREQSEAVEIVVVQSASEPARLAPLAEDAARVVELRGVPFPGATRNAGVRATAAPWVAFLAADSLAAPGWSAARLSAHRAGAAAVATAVVPFDRRSVASWASYLSLNVRRMPGLPPGEALRYGLSYSRALLEELGPFREDLRVGEDSELNRRVAERHEIPWVPAARTVHRHPTSVAALLRDQHARGRRAAVANRELSGLSPRFVARDAVRRVAISFRLGWRYLERGERVHLLRSAPLLPLAALAYARGAATAGAGPS